MDEAISRQVLELWNRYKPTIAVDAIEYDRELKKLLGTNLASLGTDCISRQAAISAICNACGKIDCDKMDKCEKLQLSPANISETPNSSDTISRRAAIDALYSVDEYNSRSVKAIKQLPPIQPDNGLQKLADEIASFKRCVKSDNSDYLTGYLSALSVVEGMIADMRGVNNEIN